MALPRYDTPEVRLQPGAAATAFQQQAQGWSSLSQQLDQFRNIAYQEAAQQSKRKAEEDAVIDVAKGKIKDTGDFTIYDQVYKDSARVAFVTKTENDVSAFAKNTALRLKADPNTRDNPDAFAEIFDGYVKGVLAEAPDDRTRAVLKQSINKYGADQYNAILQTQIENQRKYEEESYTDGIALYKQQYKDAIVKEDQALINIATQKLIATYQAGVNSKFETEAGAALELEKLKKETFVEVSMNQFKNAPNRVEFLKTFRENKALNSEETEAAIDSMHKVMESEIKDRKILEDKEKEEHLNFQKNTKRTLNKKLINGNLTKEDLDEALKYDGIGTSDYDDLYSRLKTPGATADDDSTYNYYLKNLDSVTEEMILNDSNLTRASQDQLLNELEAREKEAKLSQKERDSEAEKLGKWESHSKGKEAIRRIKTHFKIVDGTIMSKVDLNNDNMRDYGKLRDMLFDQIEALPLEDRIHKSLELSNKLLEDYNNAKIIDTKPYNDLKAEQEKTKETWKQTDVSITSEVTPVKGANNFMKFIDKVMPQW